MSVRCFIAIELPAQARTTFLDAGNAIRDLDARWRGEKWVPGENLHVTLKFVGHIGEQSVEALVDACKAECGDTPTFDLTGASVRAVPGLRNARMVWGTFADPSGAAAYLAAAADRAALSVGAEPETRPFTPHATLARARKPHPLDLHALEAAEALVRDADPVVSVTAATVFRSTLSSKGPTYEVLATCPLAGH